MSRNRWDEGEAFEIPLTPLVDIIFNLIIFFLVATTFYTEERDLNIRLPEGTQGEAITSDDGNFVINIREGGLLVVGNKILDIGELEQQLVKLKREGGAKVEVRGDSSVRHGRIMEILNLCKKCGIANYALTQRIVHEVP